MPRVNNNASAAKDANAGTSTNVVATKGRKRAIKKEVVDNAGEQNVFHRKSERRRVARDIFLVFEEQPCRRGRGGGANNKRKATPKPKFGHLMVDEHCRGPKAGLLRDIKNEPKCYLNDECSSNTINAPVVNVTPVAPPTPPPPAAPVATPTVAAAKVEKKKNTPKAKKSKNNNANSKSCIDSKPIVIPTEKLPDPTITTDGSSNNNSAPKECGSNQPSVVEDDPALCARVNPIFLWVKQEDTHIVEVRCEDYDKRNRIRITKTTNGWRAIPRTDPTSSKIVKIIPSTLLKVKKEIYENNLLQKCNEGFNANILGRQILIQHQQQQQQQPQLEVNEKQSFVTENPIMLENILNSNNNNNNNINSKHGIIDNLMFNKQSNQIESTTSSTIITTSIKHKNKKAKTKKGKKRGRKAANKLTIPKVEVLVQQQASLQEHINQNDLALECRAPQPVPIEQLIQSNLETIQNFSKMSISDHEHHHQQQHNQPETENNDYFNNFNETNQHVQQISPCNQHSIVEQHDTASNNNNHLTEAVELHSNETKEQQTIEGAIALATTTAVSIANKTIEDEESAGPTAVLLNVIEKENKAPSEAEQTETYQHDTPHLQLCPITGLFLPTTNRTCGEDSNTAQEQQDSLASSVAAAAVADSVVNTFNTNFLSSKDILVDLANCDDDEDDAANATANAGHMHNLQDATAKLPAINATHFNTTLDADTKNLKDLLDEADLMQHCHDNALTNSDADIIDSIVKRSCENNLIQEAEETQLKEAEAAMHQQQQQQQTTPFNVNNTTQIVDNIAQHQQQQHHKDLMSTNLIDATVRDSPKCLSFNEAGEIDCLNGELFQTNHFLDTYEKDSSSVEEVCLSDDGGSGVVKKTGASTSEVTSPAHHVLKANASDDDVIMEESPKDLSYKKREEVCPPSESRSQCAVTSSSDIIKSPQQQQQVELPAIETTSEAIKNLILEQFMKLNSYNVTTLPTNASNTATVGAKQQQQQQQIEPMNLGKAQQQRDLTTATTPPSTTTTSNDCNSTYAPTTNYIETVVIDDNSDDEPMKKRIRSSSSNSSNNTIKVNKINEESVAVVGSQTHAPQAHNAAPLLIDKDPDPLTQLQLLIRNTQWKVPDPILVPKDRLRAVLASPAREIPLLITTRPELRLPEAFAYPEIIQNPNILVISMAQLEAILKNEMDMEQSKQEQELQQQQQQQCIATVAPNIPQPPLVPPIENVKKSHNVLLTTNTSNNNSHTTNSKPQSIEHIKGIKVKEPPLQHTLHTPPAPAPTTTLPPNKCSHVDTNLASDINAATLAVLNQMLWLPYFGQLSQEFIKTLNKPLGGVQNKYNAASGLLAPTHMYNHNMGLQHLDEMYKNYLKQMTALKHLSGAPDATNVNNAMPNFALPLFAAQPTMESNVFQKMLQHQLANFLNINPLATTAAATGASTPMQSGGGGGGHMVVGKSPSAHEMTTANVEHMQHMSAAVEDKKTKSSTSTTAATANITADMHGSSLIGDVAAEKSSSLSSSSLRHSSNSNNNVSLSCGNASPLTDNVNFNKYAYTMQQQQQQQQPQKQEVDNKPRLTCKSLSNLLEPAENVSSSPSIAPALVNLSTDHHHMLRNNTMAAHELASHNNINTNSIINPASIHNKDVTNIHAAAPASVDVMPHFKSGKLSNKLSQIAPHEMLAAKQRKRVMNYAAETTALATSPAMGAVAAASAASLGNQTPSRNVVAGENISVESNQALWHPLFGSNAKTGYSSPWQWTTVTATGE